MMNHNACSARIKAKTFIYLFIEENWDFKDSSFNWKLKNRISKAKARPETGKAHSPGQGRLLNLNLLHLYLQGEVINSSSLCTYVCMFVRMYVDKM